VTLLLAGLSHTSAPVSVRERYALAPDEWVGACEKLMERSCVDEAAAVSTCNRTELLAYSEKPDEAAAQLRRFLDREIGDGSAGPDQIYELRGDDVVQHLFALACGLNSMVLGEAQILGQVKSAYRAAVSARSCGPILGGLFQRAFRAAKHVRSETGLGASTVSVARVGVQLAGELFESLEHKRVLLVGAGEMAESALRGFREAGVSDIVVLNRTLSTAQRVAAPNGRAAPLSDLALELDGADVALSSVQVDRPLIGLAELDRSLRGRRGRPLLLIDLGIPRNVDVRANTVDDVYLYDLDDLDGVAARGRGARESAIAPAQAILVDELASFRRWQQGLRAAPTLRQLVETGQTLGRTEVRRAVARMGGATPEMQEAIERLADSIVGKLLHGALERVRAEAEDGGDLVFTALVREILGLDEGDR